MKPSCLPEKQSRKQNLLGTSCWMTKQCRKQICGLWECWEFQKLWEEPVWIWIRGSQVGSCASGWVGGSVQWLGWSFHTLWGSQPLPGRPFAEGRPRHGEAGFSWWKSFPVDVYSLCRTSPPCSWAQTLIKRSVTWRLYTMWKLVVVQTISVTVQRQQTQYEKKKTETTKKHFAC